MSGEPMIGRQTKRRFVDFVIDGESLYEAVGDDFISPLGWLDRDKDELHARRLLLQEGPDVDDRVSVLVCPECGSVDCGAYTVRIVRDGHAVIWSDLAFSSYDVAWDESSRLRRALSRPIRKWHHAPMAIGWRSAHFAIDEYTHALHSRPRLD
jgi:hypothetical protein